MTRRNPITGATPELTRHGREKVQAVFKTRGHCNPPLGINPRPASQSASSGTMNRRRHPMPGQMSDDDTIPKITCPRCNKIMRLARVEQETDQEARLMFDCDCGFE